MTSCNICQRKDAEELLSFDYFHPSCEKTATEMIQTVDRAYDIPPDGYACSECFELLSKCYQLHDIWKQMETVELATDAPHCRLCKASEDAERLLSIFDTPVGTFEAISDLLNQIDWLHTLQPDNGLSGFCCEQCFQALSQVNVLHQYLSASAQADVTSQDEDDIDNEDATIFRNYEEEGIIYLHSLDEGKDEWRNYVVLVEDGAESYQTFIVIGNICCGCRRFFASESDLAEHQEMVHVDAGSTENHRCDRCSTNFDAIAKFQHHQQLVLSATCYHCKRCDILALNYKELRSHFQLCRGHSELQDENAQTKELLFCQHGVEERAECDYRCCGCRQVFTNNNELLQHSKEKHFPDRTIPANFQCQLCYSNFNNRIALTRHYIGYRKKVSYHCHKQDCQYGTIKRSLMVAHLTVEGNCPQTVEHPQEDSVYNCCFCRCYQSFSTYEELKTHCEETHNSERYKITAFQRITALQCELCGRCFSRRSNYADHLRRQRYRGHPCNYCEMKFSKLELLESHIKNVHTKGKRFKCMECDARFSSPGVRARHYNVKHRSEPAFICNQCGKGFNSKNNLQTHVLFVHTEYKAWACDQCPAKFKMKQSLQAHARRHTQERPFACQYCEKKYRNRHDCKRHEKSIHMNEKPFQCEQCGAAYTRDRELRLHMRKHTGRKLFTCPDCGWDTNTHASFRDHKNSCRISDPEGESGGE